MHYDICPITKQTRLSLNMSYISSHASFDLIHGDIWGPHRTHTHSGARYFLTIVDDYSCYTWIHLMKLKSETQTLLKSFNAFVKTQFQCNVKCVRADNGSEFTSMRPFFNDLGILFQQSCPATPQQNGVIERKHCHLLNVARALRFQACLPLQFWRESILTVAYIINRLPTPILLKASPYEKLHNIIPTVALDIVAALKIIFDYGKRTDFWHLVLLGEKVLFKESPLSITVIRNPNWSSEIYGLGLVT